MNTSTDKEYGKLVDAAKAVVSAKSKESIACAALVRDPYEVGVRQRYHISFIGYPLKADSISQSEGV